MEVGRSPYINSSLTVRAFEVLQSLREDEVLCDIKLETQDGTTVCGHKVVLASVSPYFRAMFTTSFEESNKPYVVIRNLDSISLKLLVDFIYTGQIKITERNVQVLLPAASLLQMYDVQDACCEFLQTQLHPTNCFAIKTLADRYGCMELLSSSESYIRQHFSEVVEGDDFLSLSLEQVAQLISSDELAVPSEEKVFESVISWVNHNSNGRRDVLPKLMEHIRLPLLSKEFLLTRVKEEPLVKNSSKCKDYLIEALEFHRLKSRKYTTMLRTELIKPRKPVGLHEVILVVGGEQLSQIRSVEWYDPATSQWQSGPEISNYSPHAGIVVLKDQRVFVVNYYGSEWGIGTIDLLDLSSPSPYWMPTINMLSKRAYPGIAVLDNCIYTVGGFDDTGSLNTAEVFDLNTLKGRLIANMSIRRNCVGVGILNKLLYAVGGSVGVSVQSLKSVECYNPSTDRWSTVAEMSVRRKSAGVGVLDGVLYAVGGIDGQEIHNSVEAYSPDTGVWTSVSDMQMCRKNPGVVALHGLLYVVGGNNRHTMLSSVEVYNPNTNTWSMLPASMNIGRSCAGVTVIDKPPRFNT